MSQYFFIAVRYFKGLCVCPYFKLIYLLQFFVFIYVLLTVEDQSLLTFESLIFVLRNKYKHRILRQHIIQTFVDQVLKFNCLKVKYVVEVPDLLFGILVC